MELLGIVKKYYEQAKSGFIQIAQYVPLKREINCLKDQVRFLENQNESLGALLSYWQNIKDPENKIWTLEERIRKITKTHGDEIFALTEKYIEDTSVLRALFNGIPYKIIIVGRKEGNEDIIVSGKSIGKKPKYGVILEVNRTKKESGDREPVIGSLMYKDYAAKHKGINMFAELEKSMSTATEVFHPKVNYNNEKYISIWLIPAVDNGKCLILSYDLGPVPKEEYIINPGNS